MVTTSPSSPGTAKPTQRGTSSGHGKNNRYKEEPSPQAGGSRCSETPTPGLRHLPTFNTTAMAISVLALGVIVPVGLGLFPNGILAQTGAERPLPEKAQIVDQKSFNALETVFPPSVANATTVSQ